MNVENVNYHAVATQGSRSTTTSSSSSQQHVNMYPNNGGGGGGPPPGVSMIPSGYPSYALPGNNHNHLSHTPKYESPPKNSHIYNNAPGYYKSNNEYYNNSQQQQQQEPIRFNGNPGGGDLQQQQQYYHQGFPQEQHYFNNGNYTNHSHTNYPQTPNPAYHHCGNCQSSPCICSIPPVPQPLPPPPPNDNIIYSQQQGYYQQQPAQLQETIPQHNQSYKITPDNVVGIPPAPNGGYPPPIPPPQQYHNQHSNYSTTPVTNNQSYQQHQPRYPHPQQQQQQQQQQIYANVRPGVQQSLPHPTGGFTSPRLMGPQQTQHRVNFRPGLISNSISNLVDQQTTQQQLLTSQEINHEHSEPPKLEIEEPQNQQPSSKYYSEEAVSINNSTVSSEDVINPVSEQQQIYSPPPPNLPEEETSRLSENEFQESYETHEKNSSNYSKKTYDHSVKPPIETTEQLQEEDSEEFEIDQITQNYPTGKSLALVPFGWKRLILSDKVIYYSPSGIQLKSIKEIQEYLSTEGTCKCGLECSVILEKSFDFDHTKQSEMWSLSKDKDSSNDTSPKFICQHKKNILAMVSSEKTGNKIQHTHSPKGKKKKKKKLKAPYSGMTMSEMIQAREIEKQRINEIINQQKREHDARTKDSSSSSSEPLTKGSSDNDDNNESLTQAPPRLEPYDKDDIGASNSQTSSDNVKNLEIRRMSATEEGDKVLQWQSPEKNDPGKTPLEMVENIVSNLDIPTTGTTTTTSTSTTTNNNNKSVISKSTSKIVTSSSSTTTTTPSFKSATKFTPPSWTTTGPPLLHSQQIPQPNQTLPKPQPPPPILTVSTNPGPSTAPSGSTNAPTPGGYQPQTIQIQSLVPQPQPVMQIVNTINGPVLMQTVPQFQFQTSPISQQQQQPLKQPPVLKKKGSKGSKSKRTAPQIPSASTTPTTILMSPSGQPPQPGQVLISQPSPGTANLLPSTAILPAQNLVISQSPPMMNQMIISNGTTLMMPQQHPQQAIVYNQLPDGTLVQVQQNPNLLTFQQPPNNGQTGGPPQPPQQLLTTSGQILTNPGGGGAPSTAGTLIMTPNGQLVQASPNTSIITMVPPRQQPIYTSVTSAGVTPTASTSSTSVSSIYNDEPPVLSPKAKLKKSKTSKTVVNKEIVKPIEDDDIDFEEDDGEDDEEEEEDGNEIEEPVLISSPKYSKKSSTKGSPSSKSYLQSNQVDSSGLKATPPHNASDLFDALTKSDLNSSRGSSLSSSAADKSRSRILFEDDSDSETENNIVNNSRRKKAMPTSSSTPIKKKRKKRSAEDLIIQEEELKQDSEEDEGDQVSNMTESPTLRNRQDFKVGDLVWGSLGSFPSWPGKLVRGIDDESKVLVCWFGTKTITEVDPTTLKTLSEGFDAHHKERKKMRKSRKLNASLEKAIQEAMMELDTMDG